MKINRKSAEKDDTYCAYKEGKATVTSIFEIAKDLEFDRITVGPELKAAGYSRANTSPAPMHALAALRMLTVMRCAVYEVEL